MNNFHEKKFLFFDLTIKNEFQVTSLNGRAGEAAVITSSSQQPNSGSASANFKHRRWVSQPSQGSQSSKQHSIEDGGSHVGSVGGSGNTTSVQQPRRISPASDPKEINSSSTISIGTREKTERYKIPELSILHNQPEFNYCDLCSHLLSIVFILFGYFFLNSK